MHALAIATKVLLCSATQWSVVSRWAAWARRHPDVVALELVDNVIVGFVDALKRTVGMSSDIHSHVPRAKRDPVYAGPDEIAHVERPTQTLDLKPQTRVAVPPPGVFQLVSVGWWRLSASHAELSDHEIAPPASVAKRRKVEVVERVGTVSTSSICGTYIDSTPRSAYRPVRNAKLWCGRRICTPAPSSAAVLQNLTNSISVGKGLCWPSRWKRSTPPSFLMIASSSVRVAVLSGLYTRTGWPECIFAFTDPGCGLY